MFKYLLCSVFCLTSLQASIEPCTCFFSKDDIMVTDNGFYISRKGIMTQVKSITYAGNGQYQITDTYFGVCGRCGAPIDGNYRCTNRNCTGFGPSKH